jgi:hypothetical protein
MRSSTAIKLPTSGEACPYSSPPFVNNIFYFLVDKFDFGSRAWRENRFGVVG